MPYMTAEDEELAGGTANAGEVVRRGEVVDRPAPPNARALHAYLRGLREQGFDAAPPRSVSARTVASNLRTSRATWRFRRSRGGR